MKTLVSLILITFTLISCWESDSLSKKVLTKAYDAKSRSIDLSDSWIRGFVNLNDIKPDTEVGNLYLWENSIEVLNISEYKDLWKVELQNNDISFFSDVKYPEKVRQLDLSFNQLQNLDGIEKLTELQTLNLSYNQLDEEEFQKIADLTKLRLIYVDGNDVSDEFLIKIANFNFKYLSTIKK